jgi:ABC-type transporter Mla subunit MlaD
MKCRILLFHLLVLTLSCSDSNTTIFLKVDNADGLKENALVNLNGLKVGRIKNISLDNDYKVIAEIVLEKGVTIPKDSEFKIFSEDIIGTKAVNLTPGKMTEKLKNNDTVYGITEPEYSIDSLTYGITNLIENIIGTERSDSLTTEIKRLNNNLEKLNK